MGLDKQDMEFIAKFQVQLIKLIDMVSNKIDNLELKIENIESKVEELKA